ncbi:hypothetical protein IAD21_06032 [Abditibacteriota bacterium]|nr:hypothetical protein IAD21_06032 [Abditibacteriota bacterium]
MSALTKATRVTWSATRLKTYLTCPRQFKYVYVDGIPAIPTAPLVFGGALHEALCFGHEQQMISGQLPPTASLLARFDALWQDALETDEPFFRAGGLTPPQYVRTGHEILRAYAAAPDNATAPLAAELAFELEIGGYGFTGVVDRLDEGKDGLVIVDFKSGARKPTKADLEGDLQFTLYALAIEGMLGRPVERVVHYHLRDGSRFDVMPSKERSEQLLVQVVPQVDGAISQGEFAPKAGYWCNWCHYRELCRAENAIGNKEAK